MIWFIVGFCLGVWSCGRTLVYIGTDHSKYDKAVFGIFLRR